MVKVMYVVAGTDFSESFIEYALGIFETKEEAIKAINKNGTGNNEYKVQKMVVGEMETEAWNLEVVYEKKMRKKKHQIF